VFRLNIGVSRETFRALFGHPPSGDRTESTDNDFAALDRLMPHPAYARQSCVCVLNPSPDTFEAVKPLLAEAYSIVAARHIIRNPRQTGLECSAEPAKRRPIRRGYRTNWSWIPYQTPDESRMSNRRQFPLASSGSQHDDDDSLPLSVTRRMTFPNALLEGLELRVNCSYKSSVADTHVASLDGCAQKARVIIGQIDR